MYILGRTQMIPAASYKESIARIMKKGFDGVELDIYDVNFQARKEFFEEGFAEKIKECMKKNGVKAYSIGAHMDFTENEDKFRTVEKAIPIAAAVGTDTVIINGAVRREGEAFEKQWERQINRMKELCRIAEEYEVYLAVEFEPGFVIDNSELLLKAFEQIGSPILRMNADIGHMFLQDPDPLASIDKCGPYIVHAHLENMKKGIHNHLVPYEGDMDLTAYLQKLISVGFDGPASLDVYQYDYEAVAEKSVEYLKQILCRQLYKYSSGRQAMKKILSITFLLMFCIMTACTKEKARAGPEFITFPAYEEENPAGLQYVDEINNTDEFQVSVSFPGTWTLKSERPDVGAVIPGDFYTPLYIYEEDALIGYIGFNKFEPTRVKFQKSSIIRPFILP